MDEYQSFSLRKIVGPTQIYGCVKDRSRSTVENMSRSRISHGVQRRKVGGKRDGMWMVEVKYSSDKMARKAPRVQVSHPIPR